MIVIVNLRGKFNSIKSIIPIPKKSIQIQTSFLKSILILELELRVNSKSEMELT